VRRAVGGTLRNGLVLLAVFVVASACSAGSGSPRSAPTPSTLDPYGDDPIVLSGTKAEVCRGGAAADRPGRKRLAAHIEATWPAALDVQGYECREILDPTHPECDREIEPDRSDCWSMHAAGRAIDVVVGGEPDVPTPAGRALGDEIVTDFLRTRNEVGHALARSTGVQEIIWNGHCWYPRDGDVTSAARMAPCPIRGHSDHVHLTLSEAGADAGTSWYAR
jgi:hypothetical protein